jgi:hypothetical protein
MTPMNAEQIRMVEAFISNAEKLFLSVSQKFRFFALNSLKK